VSADARPASEEGTPLPSGGGPGPLEFSKDEEGDEEEGKEEEGEESLPSAPSGPPPPPPMPQFKFSTFVFTFLFVIGIFMIFDTGTRNAVASTIGLGLEPLIGFGYHYVLLTMFLAGLIEMALTALAYNWTTDWVKTARTQAWSTAFRKVQMEAVRSGKKDRVDALKPHQAQITKLSSELSISQLKGMAITWFLVIAIYTWVGLFLAHAYSVNPSLTNVYLGGFSADILHKGVGPIPDWIVLFSLYTFPLSYVLRRALKHYSLREYELKELAKGTPSVAGPSA
jgi:uncharacterized membrane protein (DUF106 family)